MTSISTGIKAVDYIHRLKAKPFGWWLTAAGMAAVCILVWLAPKAQVISETVAKLDERTGRMEKAVDRIETALINRGAMTARTDVDHDVAQRVADEGMVPPFRLDFLGSAEASDVAGRGPVRRGVPARDRAAGDGDRVVKEVR